MSEQVFQQSAKSISADIPLDSARSFELVFEDQGFVTRTSLATDDATVITDVYVHDVRLFYGGVRRSLIYALLTINYAAIGKSDFFVSIDTRGFLVLTGRTALDKFTAEQFPACLTFWLEQALRIRKMASAIGFEGGTLQYETTASKET